MTISSTTRKAGPYLCNGATVLFPFAFKVFSTSDVRVVLTDASAVESDLTLGTHYTVSLNSDQDANPGGTVTSVATYASGNLITLTSQVQNLQSVMLTNQGGFYPKVINDALDRLTILVQQIAEKLGRSLSLPISSSGVSSTLPNPQAGSMLGWSGDGTALTNYTGLSSTPVSAPMTPVVQAASLAAARTALGAAGISDTNTLTNKTLLASGANTVEATSGPSGSSFDNRNRVLNSNFDSWPDGTSFANPASIYTADAWQAGATNSTVYRAGGAQGYGRYALGVLASAASNTCLLSHVLEQADVRPLQGKNVTLSFFYQGSVNEPAGSLAVSVQKNATPDTLAGGSWTTLATVSGTTSYSPTTAIQRASLTVAVPADGTAEGLRINIQTTNITNASTVYVFGVKLEEGAAATPYSAPDLTLELKRLGRRYLKITYSSGGQGGAGSVAEAEFIKFPVTMRAVPSVSRIGGGSTNLNAAAPDNPSVDGCRVVFTTTAAGGWNITNDVLTANARL